MRIIEPEEAPIDPKPRRQWSKWSMVYEAIEQGKVVEIDPAEYDGNENAIRNSVAMAMRRWGRPVTIRKDPASGNLYVFPLEPTESDTIQQPLLDIVEEWDAAQQEEQQ